MGGGIDERAIQAIALGCAMAGCLLDPDRPCGDHYRESSRSTCVCPEGSVPVEGRCEPESEDPEDERPSARCEADSGACTCDGTSECARGMLCDSFGSGRCIAEPAGLNQPCASDSECSGEAGYCELFSSGTCQIDGCADRAGICPGDMACCDYVVIGRSLCVPASELESGDCPAPGRRVPRE